MIDSLSVLYLISLHLSYIGVGLYWSDFQKKSNMEQPKNLGFFDSVFKNWAIGVFIYSDGISEDAETFTLKLTNSSEGTLDGTNGTIDVIGTIENSQSSIILLPFVVR